MSTDYGASVSTIVRWSDFFPDSFQCIISFGTVKVKPQLRIKVVINQSFFAISECQNRLYYKSDTLTYILYDEL